MNRVKESGAEFRKKRAKKEAHRKKSQGALLKYFSSSFGSKATLTSSVASCSSESDSSAQEEDVPAVAVGSRSGPTTEQSQDEVDSPEVPQASSHKPVENVNVAREDIIEIVPSAPAEAKDVNFDNIGCWPSHVTDEIRTLLVRRGSDSIQHIDSKFTDVVRSETNFELSGVSVPPS